MSTPTIGRIVHYTFHGYEQVGQSSMVPAIIVAVWSDTCVNLQVFPDAQHSPVWITSVEFSEVPGREGHWNWPPRVE